MKESLTSYIELLEPWISPTLVSLPYLSRIKAIGAELPVLSFGCFECWLEPGEPRVDFNIAINGKLNEHKALCEWLTIGPESGNRGTYPESNQYYSFFRSWQEKDFYLLPMIRAVWLVYDIAEPRRPTPFPWLYVHFMQTPLNNNPVVRTEIILQIHRLWEQNETSCESQQLRIFLNSIIPAVEILALGKPTGRQGPGLRLYLKIKTFDELTKFLLNKHWPGHVDDLQEKLHSLITKTDFYCLILDLGEDFSIRPKIGIECWFEESLVQDKLGRFSQELVDRGICDPLKREELLIWNGTFRVETQLDFWSWPDSMSVGQNSKTKKVLIRRMAHYVKIIFEPERKLVAKAYLYFDRSLNQ